MTAPGTSTTPQEENQIIIYQGQPYSLISPNGITEWDEMEEYIGVCVKKYTHAKWLLVDAIVYAYEHFEDDFVQRCMEITGCTKGTILNYITVGKFFTPQVRQSFPALSVTDCQAIPKKFPREIVLSIAQVANAKIGSGEWNREDLREFIREIRGQESGAPKENPIDVLRDLYNWALVSAQEKLPDSLSGRIERLLMIG